MAGLTVQIILDPESRAWRRRLGPLPWAVLEELAQQAQPGQQGWVAPVGVRAIGAALGVTKDTAARAITTLARNRIVTRLYINGPDQRPRSAYRLHLPEGVVLRSCPAHPDDESVVFTNGHPWPKGEYASCPDGEYASCPDGEYASCPDGEYASCPDGEYGVGNNERQADPSTAGVHRTHDKRRLRRAAMGRLSTPSTPTQTSLFDSPDPTPD
jgi:hypothetical protein